MPGPGPFLFHAILFMMICLLSGPAWGAPVNTRQLDDLERSAGVKLHYTRHHRTGAVRSLRAEPGRAIPRHVYTAGAAADKGDVAPETAAADFLGRYGDHFGINDPSRELRVKRTRTADRGRSFVRFQQLHNGLPVIGGEMVVQLDSANGVMSAHGTTSPDAALDTTPGVSAAEAKETALKAVVVQTGTEADLLTATEPELSVYDPALLDHRERYARVLVWRLEVTAVDLSPLNEFVLIDAKTGRLLLQFNQIDYAKNRTVYNNNNDKNIGLPGTIPVRTEGSPPSGDAEVNSAYDYLGDTYDFFYTSFGRDSVNGAGMGLIGTVRYCPPNPTNDPTIPCPYPNAFWNGSQMAFGQGFAAADDVVAHELTHGVTQSTSGLFNYMQSGAINESLSDIFGEFVDQTNGRGNDSAPVRWKMGEDLPGGAVRDMKDPPSMSTIFGPYPDRMKSSNYFCGGIDNGGVHINSSVGNKAAWLMTDGGSFNGRNVTGLGITKAAKIFYEAEVHLLTSASDFEDLYNDLIIACGNLMGVAGITSADCQEVKMALDAVEMNQQPTSCPASEAPFCPAGTAPVNVFFDNFESGTGNWTSGVIVGANAWASPLEDLYATSGENALYGQDLDVTSDSYIRTNDIAIPANAYLHFRHFYEFEYGQISESSPLYYFDGGVIEYSSNGGSTWQEAGPLIINNGYPQTITTLFDNPLKGRSAFSGISNGFMSSRLGLSSLSGKNARFRFRIGSDSSYNAAGWAIDDFRVYTCADIPPAVSATIPAAGETEIPIDSTVSATFTEAMNSETITSTTFTLTNQSTSDAVAGTVVYNASNLTATFTPSAKLAPNTPYSATVTAGARDLTGNPLIPRTWNFTTSTQTQTLSVSIAGTGAGAVNSSPAGIACSSGPCSAQFYHDLPVTLMASPAGGSIFAGWTGACINGSGNCIVTMDSNKSVTGTFGYFPAHIFGASPGNYPSLQAASNAAANNDIVQVQAAVLEESPLLGKDASYTIRGGYDNSFNAVTGNTVIQGTMTFQNGTVTIDNVTVR